MKKITALLLVNILTTIRIIGVICLLPIFKTFGGLAAAFLSILCYLTDCIDGILARKWHVATFFGSFFDGIADKMFTIANLVVLFTITKYALVPIVFEFAIIMIQSVKFSANDNVQSSKMGKVKTWVIGITVAVLYLLSDINKLTFLGSNIIDKLSIINSAQIIYIFIPLYLFEILTMFSYLKSSNHNHVEVTNLNIKLKKPENFHDKLSNFNMVWLNPEFYAKYKDSTGLKDIYKQIKNHM